MNTRALRVYLGLEAAYGLGRGVVFVALSVYYVTVARLDPLQLVLIGTALEGTMFCLQVPTGILADAFSRRWAIVAGFTILGAGFAAQALTVWFPGLIAATVISGAGWSLMDGAVEAWVAGELDGADLPRLFLRGGQLSQAGLLAGLPIAYLLSTRDAGLPVLAGGLVMIACGLALAAWMPERAHRTGSSWRHHLEAAGATARAGAGLLRARRGLLLLLGSALIAGLASEGYDRLMDAHLLRDLGLARTPPLNAVGWIAVLSGFGELITLAAMEGLHRLRRAVDGDAVPVTLAALTACTAGGRLVFSLAPALVLAVPAIYLADTGRGAAGPLYAALLTGQTEPRLRATVLSTSGQMDALGQVLGGPLVGLLGRATSIPVAIGASALFLLLSPPLILLAGRARPARPVPRDPACGH